MRVLITGSRIWTDVQFIQEKLDEVLSENPSGFVLVHGAAHRGVDYIAMRWGSSFKQPSPIILEPHPARWQEYKKAAGLLRNKEMVETGIDLCLAFIRDQSRGATHCATLAREAGIETRVYEWGSI